MPESLKITNPSLLSVVCNLVTKILSNRKGDALDFEQPRKQAIFRKGFSIIDHIPATNRIMEKSTEYNKHLYMSFIDSGEAIDSVETAAVMEAFREQGLEETHIRLLDDIYKQCTGTITLHKNSGKFGINKCVATERSESYAFVNPYEARIRPYSRNVMLTKQMRNKL